MKKLWMCLALLPLLSSTQTLAADSPSDTSAIMEKLNAIQGEIKTLKSDVEAVRKLHVITCSLGGAYFGQALTTIEARHKAYSQCWEFSTYEHCNKFDLSCGP